MVTNPSIIHEDVGSIPALLVGEGSSIATICGIGGRYSSDLMLPWLWQRPANAAPKRPQAQELPYAKGIAIKRMNE